MDQRRELPAGMEKGVEDERMVDGRVREVREG